MQKDHWGTVACFAPGDSAARVVYRFARSHKKLYAAKLTSRNRGECKLDQVESLLSLLNLMASIEFGYIYGCSTQTEKAA